MARGQRSKIRQRRRAPLRAKYEERLMQALIVKHKLMAIRKANESRVMEVNESTHMSQTETSNSNENTVSGKEPQQKPLSKSKLKKLKESRKRKRLGIRKGQWKWS